VPVFALAACAADEPPTEDVATTEDRLSTGQTLRIFEPTSDLGNLALVGVRGNLTSTTELFGQLDEGTSFAGLAVPRATPPAVVARLNKEVRAVLALPDVAKRLTDMGGKVTPTSSDEMRRHVEGEIAKWKKIVAERKIEVEWTRSSKESFQVKVQIHTDDRPGMLAQFTSILAAENCNIKNLEAHTDHKSIEAGAVVDMTIEVRDRKQLEKIFAALRRVSGVRDVTRIH
jgi:predicted amino acid-binding ACT domain protein